MTFKKFLPVWLALPKHGQGNDFGKDFGTYKSADISRYTDVSCGSWYYDYIAQAVHMGTFAGYANNRMGPNDNITREQAREADLQHHRELM